MIGVLGAGLGFAGGAAGQSQFSCLGAQVTIEGTQGDDTLVGTENDDVIFGFGGNDVIDGRGGNDRICVSEGVNVAQGGLGNDQIEGGPQDDLLVGDQIEGGQQAGNGDDDIAGGLGADAVVGDSIAESGFAGGEGDDRVRGGEDEDVLIGDAWSGTFAVGIGDDDLQGGTGTDITVGDAMVGTPAGLAAGRSIARQDGGQAGAYGAGGDRLRTQTETDLLIGDAASFAPGGGGARGSALIDAASANCGAKLARQIGLLELFGFSEAEIEDFVIDTLIAEFANDVLIGDCFSATGKAIGGSADKHNGGDAKDLLVGGNVATVQAKSDAADKDEMLGGKDGDCASGDNNAMELIIEELETIYGVRCAGQVANLMIQPKGRNQAVSGLFGHSYGLGLVPAPPPPPRRTGAVVSRGFTTELSGGGADVVRGGQGDDALEGGPKRDRCSGGPGSDDFVTKGRIKCETVTGDP